MEPKYKVNPLTGELQEYVFEYNGILALRNFTARVEDERLILHAADDVNFSILEALVSEVEINGVVYDNPTAAQEALTRLTFNQNRPVLLDKSLKDLILGAVQKIPGKKLTTEDFTTELRNKLEGLQQVDTSGLLPKGGYTGTAQDLKNLIDAINRILQSDDTDLDQLQEIVTYIKQNKHILSTLGISNIAGLVDALAAKAEKNHHHDERYAPKEHHHNEYSLRTHRHNKDDIDGLPNNLATTENVKTAIEGIQIGGRNLVLKSKLNVTNSHYGIVSIILSEEPKVGEKLTVTIKGVLGSGKRVFTLYNKSGSQELCVLQDKGNGIFQSTFNWRSDPTNPKLLVIYIYDNSIIVNSTIEWIKIERGNTATDWSPAPEDFDFFKGNIQLSDLNTFKNRETGGFSVNTGGGWGAYLNFKLDGSTSSLEFFKPNWYPSSRMGIRNSVDSSRFNDDNGGFRDLAWYDDILRSGVECTQNLKLQREHQNQTLFVTTSCNIDLSLIDDMSSVSFLKTFDGGNVTFSCAGKHILYKGVDNAFNGNEGSTAVVCKYGNKCYIKVSNV